MLINRLYKHISNTDVVICPEHLKFSRYGTIVKIQWWNVAMTSPICLGKDTIFIRNEDVSKWKEYGEQTLT